MTRPGLSDLTAVMSLPATQDPVLSRALAFTDTRGFCFSSPTNSVLHLDSLRLPALATGMFRSTLVRPT